MTGKGPGEYSGTLSLLYLQADPGERAVSEGPTSRQSLAPSRSICWDYDSSPG